MTNQFIRSSQASSTSNDVSEEELEQAIKKARQAVLSVLGYSLQDDVDDVLQETWLSASRYLPNFDGTSLQAWVNTIARRRARDHLKSIGRRQHHQEQFENEAISRVENHMSLVKWDFTESIDDQDEAHVLVDSLISKVESFVQNQTTCARALELITTFDDEVEEAARAMTISENTLRACRREFVRCAVVVARAIEARDKGERPTVRALHGCMPDEGDSGEWVSVFVGDVLRCGGFGNVDMSKLMQVTGKSYNTVRQYLAESHWLMRVAMTVMTSNDD